MNIARSLSILIIFAASSANATLFTYDMTFAASNPTQHSNGYGRIVADSESDALVLFAMKSTDSTSGFEVDFLWEGNVSLNKTITFGSSDLVYAAPFTALNSATGLPLTVQNEFMIFQTADTKYAHRLDQNYPGEFWTTLSFGDHWGDTLYASLTITKVPESSALMLFVLGFGALLFSRRRFNWR